MKVYTTVLSTTVFRQRWEFAPEDFIHAPLSDAGLTFSISEIQLTQLFG